MSQIWQVNTLWSHHDAHLHTLTNVLTKCQPSTPCGIQDPVQDFKPHGHYNKVKSRSHTSPAPRLLRL